jgi:SNF2 family DNA or RNA helicase
VTDEMNVVHDVPSNRVTVLMDVLAETSGKAIIWCRYRRDIEHVVEALAKVYGEQAVVQYHGGTAPAARETASKRFQEDPTCLYMVSNPQTGGYGNTWTAASTVIYFSNDYDLEKRLQSEDRAHRAGQTKSVTYVDLYVPKTVEEKIIKSLRSKIDISTAIMGDGYRSWLV